MKIINGSISGATTTEQYLHNVGIKFPEVKKKVITRFCEDKGSAILADMLATGRVISNEQLANNKDKMRLGGNSLDWAVESRHRNLVTFVTATPIVGNGVGNSSVTITLSPKDGYLKAGNVIRVVHKATGVQYLLMLTSSATPAGANFTYTAKLVTSDNTLSLPVGLVVANDEAGWSYTMNSADCTNDQFTCTPTTFPEWHKNYNTTLRVCKTMCKSGIQTVTWIENANGEKCYAPVEEAQFYYDVFKSFANGIIYGKRTYNSAGAITITDANGNLVGAGDGILEQIDSSSVKNWQVSTYLNTPSNYQAFREYLQNEIVVWGLREGITSGLLNLYTGKAGKMFLQEVLRDFATTSNGCCVMTSFKSDGEQVQMVLNNVTHYEFAGFQIVLREEPIFNDVSQHPANSTLGGLSLEGFRMILIPDKSCDNEPLVQIYFRGGCGVEDSLEPSIRPGTIDPRNKGGKSSINVTGLPGYEMLVETEYQVVLTNPYGLLHFSPFV